MKALDTINLIRELAGDKCRCGKAKRPKQTFCRSCYFSLPEPMRAALYDRIGEGYEQAYGNAVAHLEARNGQ